jgi:hypothetical protein
MRSLYEDPGSSRFRLEPTHRRFACTPRALGNLLSTRAGRFTNHVRQYISQHSNNSCSLLLFCYWNGTKTCSADGLQVLAHTATRPVHLLRSMSRKSATASCTLLTNLPSITQTNKLRCPSRMVSSGLLRRVDLVRTDVSEEPGARFL